MPKIELGTDADGRRMLMRWGEEAAEKNVSPQQQITSFKASNDDDDDDNEEDEKIIKNPFDIVQLTLQLFAPLTELMELAKFLPSPCDFIPAPSMSPKKWKSEIVAAASN